MKKIVLLSVIFIATICFTQAGEPIKNVSSTETQIVLKGKVIDKKTGETLVGAIVNVGNSEYKTYTDLNGNFEIKNVKEGNYNIVVSYISYKSSLLEQAIVKSNNNSSLEIELIEDNK
ncbi:MAG: carboxypeptidase-like regulatory domain-containing protein [Bacteroidales bacterium]